MSTDSSLQAVLGDLESAFPPHPLDPEHAFAEWGGTYLGADDFKAGVRGRLWSTIPSTFLEFHHDAVHFLGPSSLPTISPRTWPQPSGGTRSWTSFLDISSVP